MTLGFEWDDDKAEANRRKHRVSFEEAQSVFADRNVIVVYDEAHSEIEDRWWLIGISNRGRVVIVTYTKRSPNVRIISARLAERRFKKLYEDQEP